MAHLTEIVLLQFSQNQHPVYRRGHTEGGHPILFYHRQELCRIEPAPDIIDHNSRPLIPLTKQFAPGALSPPRVGHSEMQIGTPDIMPEPPGDNMAQRITVIMQHHLRLSRRPRRKEDQHGIGGFRR